MKKILSMTIFSDPRCQGGIETFNRNLKEFYSENLKMIAIKNRRPKIYDVENIVEIGSNNLIYKIINKILKNKLRKCQIKKVVKNEKSEAIIFSYLYEVELLKDIPSKKILVQHFDYSNYITNLGRKKEEYIKLLKESIDYLIVLSPESREKFIKDLNIVPEKIKVIRHSSKMEILKDKKIKNKKLIIVARLDIAQKGLDLAVKVMRKLPEFTLDIYGEEHYKGERDKLEKMIKAHGITNVYLRGATNQVKEKLDESGIYIMTSIYEGYGITNIEAMRRGLPIVLRDTFDAAKDIVIDNGVLLEKEWDEDKFVEAVWEVYNNYEYYSENSKKLGMRHSPEIIKNKWDKLLENN